MVNRYQRPTFGIAEDKGGVKVAADRLTRGCRRFLARTFRRCLVRRGTERDACRAADQEMVAKTQLAITGEDTRYFLNGALFVCALSR